VLNDTFDASDKNFVLEHWLLENKYISAEKLESIIWWWEMPVSDIKFAAPLVISDESTAGEALLEMETCDRDNAIVVDVNCAVQGIVTHGK